MSGDEPNEIPDVEEVSIPSSVREQGAKAEIATQEAGNYVPAYALQELVDEWEEIAAMQHPDELDVFNARCDTWRKAADELQTLIEEKT